MKLGARFNGHDYLKTGGDAVRHLNRVVGSMALFFSLLIIIAFSNLDTASADDYQYAIWPFRGAVVFTQTYGPQNAKNHHYGNAIDVCNADVYAPFDLYCTEIRSEGNGNQVLFQSADLVHLADGSLQIVKLSLAHDDNINDCKNWKNNNTLIKQGTKIYSPGNSGDSTGAHVHAMFGVTYDCYYESITCAYGCSNKEWRLNHTMDWNQAFYLCKDEPFISDESKFDYSGVTKKTMVSNFKTLESVDALRYPFTELGSVSLTFAFKSGTTQPTVARAYPYGDSELKKTYSPGDTVVVKKVVENKHTNIWYQTTEGYYVWDGVLDYAEAAPEVTSKQDVDLAMIVKEHPSQPMYENRTPHGFWIKPVEHHAGDLVHAVKQLTNAVGSTWYKLESGGYMWSEVLEITGAYQQYTFATDVPWGGGTVNASGTSFYPGQTVNLTAVPETGYAFVDWFSDNEGEFADPTSASTTFKMPNGNTTVSARFVPVDYFINVEINGSGTCTYPTASQYGNTVEITAVPQDGYTFAGWSSDDLTISSTDAANTTYSFTMPAKDVTIHALFVSESIVISDWQEDVAIPEDIDQNLLEIMYKHHYETVSATSPGDGWVRGGVANSYYQNSGAIEEYPYEKTTSATYVYVGGYYYHWCGSNHDCNYQKTVGKYETYHGPNALNSFNVVSSGVDTNNSSIKWYKLEWKPGNVYSGAATCATGQTANWYRMYQYQKKVLVTEYTWTKDTDWINTPDPSAASSQIKWRFNFPANGGIRVPAQTSVIEDEAFYGTNAEYFYLSNAVSQIGDNAFPNNSFVFLNTAELESFDFEADDVWFIEIGDAYNNSFAQKHSNYFLRIGSSN